MPADMQTRPIQIRYCGQTLFLASRKFRGICAIADSKRQEGSCSQKAPPFHLTPHVASDAIATHLQKLAWFHRRGKLANNSRLQPRRWRLADMVRLCDCSLATREKKRKAIAFRGEKKK